MKSLISRQAGPSPRRVQGHEDPDDPQMMQQYVDYMILDPSQSSVHMQTPLLDPYTYRQVGKVNKHCSIVVMKKMRWLQKDWFSKAEGGATIVTEEASL